MVSSQRRRATRTRNFAFGSGVIDQSSTIPAKRSRLISVEADGPPSAEALLEEQQPAEDCTGEEYKREHSPEERGDGGNISEEKEG
jgi:hypothetical protein